MNGIRISGLKFPLYMAVFCATCAAIFLDEVPEGLVGGLLLLMVFGEGFRALGENVPFVKTYLGGSVIAILGGAALGAFNLLPEHTLSILYSFVNREGFLVFYIASLITGSLFRIDRKLLFRATVRILPIAVLSIAVGSTVIVLLCMASGGTIADGLLYVAIPMTGGGMTAGAVPLSAMYAEALSKDAGEILTRIAPATVLGNIFSIFYAALGNRLGEKIPWISGDGKLLPGDVKEAKQAKKATDILKLGKGLLFSLFFYQLSEIGNHFLIGMPTYAWMILLVFLAKVSGIVPEEMEEAASVWGEFTIHAFTAAALTGIGITLLNLKAIAVGLTPMYVFTVAAGVAAISVTAGVAGRKIMGFFPLESAIAAGMCTTNMGGSGNVAVLSSANRLELLPFAQIVTRTCGALMLTVGGVLIHFLGSF